MGPNPLSYTRFHVHLLFGPHVIKYIYIYFGSHETHLESLLVALSDSDGYK